MRIRSYEKTEGARPPRKGDRQRPEAQGPDGTGPDVPRGSDTPKPKESRTPNPKANDRIVEASQIKAEPATLESFLGRADVFAIEDDTGWNGPHQLDYGSALADHLEGKITLGTYVVVGEKCRFVCFDVDDKDMLKVTQLMSALHPPFLVEDTGGRGYHVWVLFSEWVPAAEARAWAKGICRKAGVNCEIYPKQDKVPEGGVGSLIRVPLSTHRKTLQQSRFVYGELGFQDLPKEGVDSGAEGRYNGGDGKYACLFNGEVGGEGTERNNWLFRFRRALEGMGVPEVIYREWVWQVNDQLAEPLDEDEMERSILRPIEEGARRGR